MKIFNNFKFINKLKIDHKLIKYLDWQLLILVILLSCFGVLNIYSVTFHHYHYYFVYRQIAWIIISSTVIYLLLLFDYKNILNYIGYAYVLNIFLLIYAKLFSVAIKGAKVWIKIGNISLEPGEFMRIVIILILAREIQKINGEVNNPKNLFKLLIYIMIPVILIAIAPDMGLVLIIFFTVLAIFFIVNLNFKMFGVGLLCLLVSVSLLWNLGVIKPYQKQRITSFFTQEEDSHNSNYQLKQSKIAIGSGGLLGEGFTKSTFIQGNFVPESHTDFIFSVIASEWGFIGSITLLLLYILIGIRLIAIARTSKDISGTIICIGVFASLLFSMLQNIGMTIGIMPISGITLPFISYGGSSILSNFIGIGLALNVSMRRRKINF